MTVEERRVKAQEMYDGGRGKTIREIASELGVSSGTAHRYVNPAAYERYLRVNREERRRKRSEQSRRGR